MLVKSTTKMQELLRSFGGVFAYDTETVGVVPPGAVTTGKDALVLDRSRIIIMSFCGRNPDGELVSFCVFSKDHFGGDHPGVSDIIKTVRPFMEDEGILKIAHNANYDGNVMRNHGVRVVNQTCTLVEGRCLDENMPGSLKDRAALVGMALWKTKLVDFTSFNERAVEYATQDALAAFKLWEYHREADDEMFRPENRWLYAVQEQPLIEVVQDMEREGMYVDRAYFAKMFTELTTALANIDAQIFTAVGGAFNLNSPKQLADVLYNKLGVPPIGPPGKTGVPSTDEKTLFQLQGKHPVVRLIMERRHLSKLADTYIDPSKGITSYADSDSRIHATIQQTGAKTFRCSCSLPNLQNVPARSEWGKRIRGGFKAPPGHRMIVADFSMFELVMLANFSQDPEMCSVLADPKGDLHQKTADKVGVERFIAKVLNFGLTYGMGAQKLQLTLAMQGVDVTVDEARAYIRGFFSTYAGIDVLRTKLLDFHRKAGYIKYISGRVRRVQELGAADNATRSKAEREVLNNLIQGSCADWTKQAMLRVHHDPVLRNLGFKMVMQVHDEIVGYVPERGKTAFKATERATQRLKELMQAPVMNPVIPITVPIRVGAGSGYDWASAK